MIIVNDICDYLNKIAPFDIKCNWDNCGLLIGDKEKTVSKIGFTLDLTPAVLKNAIENKVDLIITHHPVIFKAQKNLLSGNIAYETAINGISVISVHTCYDNADSGVSDILAETLELHNIKTVKTNDEYSPVRIGTINKISSLKFAEFVANKLNTTVRFAGSDKEITTIAVCGGSGGDFINDVFSAGADAYVTGDLNHHDFLVAEEKNKVLIAAGHFETENISLKPLMDNVKKQFGKIELIYLHQNNPVKFIG